MNEKNLGAQSATEDVSAGSIASDAASHAAPTPGPWMVSSSWIVCTSEARIVARCEPFGIEPLNLPLRECTANAHLIAAAPEMYEALKQIVEHEQIDGVGIRYTFDFHSPFGKAVRAAIAKAEGRIK